MVSGIGSDEMAMKRLSKPLYVALAVGKTRIIDLAAIHVTRKSTKFAIRIAINRPFCRILFVDDSCRAIFLFHKGAD